MPERMQSYEGEIKAEHECGIAMYYTSDPTPKQDILVAMGNALQHRGQNGAGISSSAVDGRRVGAGLLEAALSDEDRATLDGPSYWGMIHLRYGTSGSYD